MSDEEATEATTGEVVDSLADTPGQWLTIEKAADRLVCSQRTVWRMISRGELRRRGVGGRAEVFVPTGMPRVGTPSSDMVPATRATSDTSAELAQALRSSLVALERLANSDTVLDTLIRANAETIERQAEEIGRLKAELAAEHERRARPWWRFW